MIYKNESTESEILHHDTYKGHQFFVVSYGSHPCCYVSMNTNTIDPDDVDCHGGITYTGDMQFESFGTVHCIGWDYTHFGDYSGFFPQLGGKKYFTKYMVEECCRVIDQLVDSTREE